MPTRRFFLRNSALAMVGVGASPLWLERALYAGTPLRRARKFWSPSSSAAPPTG